MALENVRLVESIVIDKDDPRALEANDASEWALKHHRWYVVGTNEPVTFASKDEARRYLQGAYQVGDYVELDRGWPTVGHITEITNDDVRVVAPNKTLSWRFDHGSFVNQVMTWRRGK